MTKLTIATFLLCCLLFGHGCKVEYDDASPAEKRFRALKELAKDEFFLAYAYTARDLLFVQSTVIDSLNTVANDSIFMGMARKDFLKLSAQAGQANVEKRVKLFKDAFLLRHPEFASLSLIEKQTVLQLSVEYLEEMDEIR